MNILLFTDHFRPEPSAPAAHLYERARLWVRDGHRVTVLTSAPNFPEGRVYAGYRNSWRAVEMMDGIRVVRVKTFIVANEGLALRTLDYVSYMVSSFLFGTLEPTPDVVVSSSPHLFVPMAALAWAKMRRVPHVMEVRDLWPASIASTAALRSSRAYRLLERIELMLYRNSARVLLLTPSFMSDLVGRGVSADHLDVVINGANLELFQPRPRDDELARTLGVARRFTIGYLGTLGLAHDLENVIRAAEILRRTNVSFLFVGVGAAKEVLQREVEQRGLTNVVFAPRQLKEDMPRYWSVCHASLVHLKNDPLFSMVIPSKIFESMAMGLPIVYVGPPGEGSKIVERHDAGIVIAPGDPDVLAAAVSALERDSSRRTALAEHSFAAAPLYSRQRHAQDTMKVLEKAIATCV